MPESTFRADYTVDDDGTAGVEETEDTLLEHSMATNEAFACTPAGQVAAVKHFFTGLLAAYTPRFTAFVGMTYGLIKGLAYLGVLYVQLPYFKGLGLSGSEYQKLYNVSQMAFAIKPAIGVMSDSIPFFGYHKRYYYALACVIGSVSVACVNLLPDDPSSGNAAGALFFLFMGAVATTDLLTEGKYSEIMGRDKTGYGSSVVTWVWLMYMTGGLIAAAVEGTIAENYGAKLVLWLMMPLPMLLFIPTVRGWMPETKIVKQSAPLTGNTRVSSGRFGFTVSAAAQQHKGTLALAVLTSVVAVALAIISLLASRTFVLVGLLVMSTVMLVCSFAVLPLVIAKAFLFMFMREMLYMQILGALDYFYTADAECLPDGPQFSYELYQTVGNIAANLAGIAGTVIFQRFLIDGSFRRVFWLTNTLKIMGSLFDIVIVKRWNVAMGIPDKVWYIFGDGVVYQITTMLDFMPSVVLISRMCPKGMESTVYALLAGVSNLGQAASRTFGYIVMEWLEIRTTAPCDFSNLPALIVIGHCIMPLLVYPLVVLLVPPTRISEQCELESRPAKPPPEEEEEDERAVEARRSTAARQSQYAVFSAADAATELPARGSEAVVPVEKEEPEPVPTAPVARGRESQSQHASPSNRSRNSSARRVPSPPRRRAGSISEAAADAAIDQM